jgi:chromosome segregation ATPase
MAITKADVFRVADEIDASGQSPTLAAVRKALGGGSFTTISQPLSEWKARKNAKDISDRELLPASIGEQLTEMGMKIWHQALSLANGRLDAERQSLEEARAETEAASKEAADMADQVSLELEEARQRVATLTSQQTAMQGVIEELKDELSKVSQRAAHSEARANEITHRVDDLNAQLARVNTQNSDLIKALAEKVTPKEPR